MKKYKNKIIFMAIVVSVALIVIGASLFLTSPKGKRCSTNLAMKTGRYIIDKTIPIQLKDCSKLYVDRRIAKGEEVTLANNLDWLYGCKLYKDFSWTPDNYLVFTDIDFIKADEKGTNAYFTSKPGRDERYIFIWNLADNAVIHELAHWTDMAHGYLSQSEEWDSIYQKEWINNEWLTGAYSNEKLSEAEQIKRFRKESFAEGFSEWYTEYAQNKYNPLRDEKEQVSHIIYPFIGGSITKENYPLTFEYMENFYENYEYDDNTLEAAELGNVSLED